MTIGEQADHKPLDQISLADNYLADLIKERAQKRAGFFTVASRPAVNEQKINKLKNFRGNNRNGAFRIWGLWKPWKSAEDVRISTVPTSPGTLAAGQLKKAEWRHR